MVAQRSPKPQVAGSSPVAPAPKIGSAVGPGSMEEGEVADKNSRRGEAVDEMFDDDVDIADADVEEQPRPTAAPSRRKPPAAGRTARKERGIGPVGRVVRFVREIVAELAKVIWPTRKELMTYTIVVVFFVSIVVAVVAGLDYLFARLMVAVFGSTS